MRKLFSSLLKSSDIEMLRREYSAGDYFEDRDYILYLMSAH